MRYRIGIDWGVPHVRLRDGVDAGKGGLPSGDARRRVPRGFGQRDSSKGVGRSMTASGGTHVEHDRRPPWRGRWWLAGAMIVALVAGGVWLALFVRTVGDPPRDIGVVVENRLDVGVVVFGQVPGEGELRLSEVAAHGTRSTGLCSGYVLIAKTSEGDEVARRSTSEDRDEIWIIRTR